MTRLNLHKAMMFPISAGSHSRSPAAENDVSECFPCAQNVKLFTVAERSRRWPGFDEMGVMNRFQKV